MELSELILHAKQADKATFLTFKNEYFEKVKAVAADVLKEPEEAELSADLSLRNAYKLLGNGVNPTVLEPWLLWLAREDALEILNRRRTLIRQEVLLSSGNLLDLYDANNRNLVFSSPEEWPLLDDFSAKTGKEELEASGADLEAKETEESIEVEKAEETIEVLETDEDEFDELFAKTADEPILSDESVNDLPEDASKETPSRSKGMVFLRIVEVLLVLLLVWFIVGFVRSNFLTDQALPDLGYSWFNTHIYPMFGKEFSDYEYVFLQKYTLL